MSKSKKEKNNILNDTFKYVSLMLLAGFAYQGIHSLVDAKPVIQSMIGIIVVVLLVKTVLNK